ncbi:MAG: 50S ribosomal protein L21 [bacterium]|nr:50S ribosomal protein L21 [bacterium]
MKPYAIIQLVGKQFKVSVGDTFVVDLLDQEPDAKLTVNDVILTSDGTNSVVGSPLVEKAAVVLKVLNHQRGKKIRVATYKAKSRYRRVKGHRQEQTVVEVLSI